MKHLGKVNDSGKLELVSRDLFLADIAQYKGKDVVISIKQKRNSRSLKQNAYYWVCVQLAHSQMLELGNEYTENQVHEFFKSKFLQVQETITNRKTGETENVMRVKSTTELDVKEFNEYIEKIARFCAEFLDIEIPLPNQN